MKIGIVTFHFVNNFGGALQAYALQKTINKLEACEAEVINYQNTFICFTDFVRLFPVTKRVKEFFSGWVTLSKRFKRKKIFSEFTKTRYKMTKKCHNNKKITKLCDEDIYVCGSDQIWNPTITLIADPAYFLGFTDKKKVAYAPSVGIPNISDSNKNKMKAFLSKFDAVSVREKDSLELVKELSGKEVTQLIDPTFLVNKEEWDEIANVPKLPEKYILLYVMQTDSSVYEYAKKMKEKFNLPIVEISRYGYNPGFVDHTIIDIGPAEFVGMFKNATYVCTNSYHGLAFSHIYEKQYCLIPSKKYGMRMSSLLDLFEIDGTLNENLLVDYDITKTREIIKREQEKSNQYLMKALRG